MSHQLTTILTSAQKTSVAELSHTNFHRVRVGPFKWQIFLTWSIFYYHLFTAGKASLTLWTKFNWFFALAESGQVRPLPQTSSFINGIHPPTLALISTTHPLDASSESKLRQFKHIQVILDLDHLRGLKSDLMLTVVPLVKVHGSLLQGLTSIDWIVVGVTSNRFC